MNLAVHDLRLMMQTETDMMSLLFQVLDHRSPHLYSVVEKYNKLSSKLLQLVMLYW